MTDHPFLLADVMAAADHFAEEIARHHALSDPEKVLLAQAVEDRAWGYLMALDAEREEIGA